MDCKDEVRVKLLKWREEKKRKSESTSSASSVTSHGSQKRFRIGQTPPPVPKSIKKVNPIKSRIDCHWTRRSSGIGVVSSSKKKKVGKQLPSKSVIESRRLTSKLATTSSNTINSTQQPTTRPISNANNKTHLHNTRPTTRPTRNIDRNVKPKFNTKTAVSQNTTKTTTSGTSSIRNKTRNPVSNAWKNQAQTKSSREKTTKCVPNASKSRVSTKSAVTFKATMSPKVALKRQKLNNENIKPILDTDLAWSIDMSPPKHVKFNNSRPATPHSKTILSQRNGNETSIRKTLKSWLESNGKTPSRFRHLMCFDDVSGPHAGSVPTRRASMTIEELTQQHETLKREERNDDIKKNLGDMFGEVSQSPDQPSPVSTTVDDHTVNQQLVSMLDECFTLFLAGCPGEKILPWLDRIENTIPLARHFTPFYICKLNVIKTIGSEKQILAVIEDAIRHNAQPSDKLAEVVSSTVKEMLNSVKDKFKTPSKTDILEDNVFDSTAIKYSVKQVTPFTSSKKRKRHSVDGRKFSPRTVVTPVRRSTRRSLSVLETKSTIDKVYPSLVELPEEDRQKALYQTNIALDEQF